MSKRITLAAVVVAALVPNGRAAAGRTQVFFAFHRYSNTNSYLTINKQDVYSGAILAQRGFRAGSGTSTDECYLAHGWLPGGWYDIVGHFDSYNASLIKGRVWQLSDKRCRGGTGTLRTQLFIHSEETADNGQYCPTSYDDSFCWEGDFDYYSSGCIKLAHARPYPSDVGVADSDWDAWDGRHGYFTSATSVFVS
jgi:hypothetical protein